MRKVGGAQVCQMVVTASVVRGDVYEGMGAGMQQ